MKRFLLLFIASGAWSQSYPPAAGLPGSTAIHKDNAAFVAWATGIAVTRGHVNISNPGFTAGGSNYATSGEASYAIGYPNGDTVSLGDGGSAIVTFAAPIINGPGFDFAVFENGSVGYLEIAFVEVSSDGVNFFRFPNHSLTQTTTQLGVFGTPTAENLKNFAGKYESNYGTPFDVSELPDDPVLNKQNITHLKIIDVVGSLNPEYASYDSVGNAVNDSFPTPFFSAGFDLQAVGVINQAVMNVDNNDLSSFQVYPNPVTEKLYFTNPSSVNITLFTLNGQQLYNQKNLENNSIDVSILPSGIYLVQVGSNGNKKNIRLVKK